MYYLITEWIKAKAGGLSRNFSTLFQKKRVLTTRFFYCNKKNTWHSFSLSLKKGIYEKQEKAAAERKYPVQCQ
jgi:hypothetical protein